MYFKTLEETIGNTPLLEIPSGNASNKILIKAQARLEALEYIPSGL